MTRIDALIADLSNLVSRHLDVTGSEFVAACERVAEGYFDDLPDDTATILTALRDALRDGLNGDVAQAE